MDFFVSYASPTREIAYGLVKTLEERGARCWIAPRDVRPGADFPSQIVEAIGGIDHMILLFSKAANDSAHVAREVFLANERGMVIIPVRIEEAQPSAGLSYTLAGLHWIDFHRERDAVVDHILRYARRRTPDAPADRPGRDASGQSTRQTPRLDPAERLRRLRQAAQQGNAEAQFRLSQMYLRGAGGVAKDIEEAAKWNDLAAAQGHAGAKAGAKGINMMRATQRYRKSKG